MRGHIRKHICNIGLAMVMVIVMSIGMTGCAKEQIPDYAAKVQVTINPDMELYVDENYMVVHVEYLNEDAKTAYSDLKLTDEALDATLNKIVTGAVEKGYLTEGKTISVDVTECTESVSAQDLTTQVEEALEQAVNEQALTATLQVMMEGEEQQSRELGTQATEATTTESQTESTTEEPTTTENPREICSNCNGTGECPDCDGGRMTCPACGGDGLEECGNCFGTGLDHGNTCTFCNGGKVHTCTHCGGVGTAMDCPVCGGSFQCVVCGGTGYMSEE